MTVAWGSSLKANLADLSDPCAEDDGCRSLGKPISWDD